HAIVPVAGSHQRQSVCADHEAGIKGTRAVLEQATDLIRDGRLKEAVVLSRLQMLAFQKRNHLIQHGAISGGADIMRDRVSEPGPIVGDARAHALTRMRQPPMLDVALDELARRGSWQMLTRHRRECRTERHPVLQLIAKSISATGLVE